MKEIYTVKLESKSLNFCISIVLLLYCGDT